MIEMLAFDTETTGLLRPEATELWLQPFIIEIYICKFDNDFKIVGEFEKLVKPPVPISDEITKITGITNQMVEDAPTFIQIYHELCDFVRGEKTIFAHNCTFDIGMIQNELARHNLVTNFPWPSDQVCTVEASMALQNKRLTLEKLCALAGITYEEGHRARNDVMMMVSCIEWLHKQELL